ncbi:hypothetical protein SRABI118_04630 [Massilia sp. Bi118]|uniref:TonB family protein n=1 Tax=Massilia sp. Bi118 TaxID=2822346 RepID=UPI001D7D5149|nr:TonB family protein [Massilia sp. Bi118]CAH0307268.1 hypothetical protein SRABI118_04630 [Massilia sp. Bi118]
MNRITSTFVLVATISLFDGPAFAREPVVSMPSVDWKQCAYPQYPKSALKNEEEGLLFLGVHVDANGAVLETKVLLSSGSRVLDETTELAFQKCRYMPGTVDGQAHQMWLPMQYFWTLEPSTGRLMQRLAKAALEGNARSRYVLGAILEIQGKTERERSASLELEFGAAEGGEAMAQLAVAAMYEHGTQVGKNLEEARRWYGLAAAQGNVIAIDRLRFIGAR